MCHTLQLCSCVQGLGKCLQRRRVRALHSPFPPSPEAAAHAIDCLSNKAAQAAKNWPQRGLYRLFTAERWPRRESSGGVRVPRRPPSASCVTGCTYRSNSGENRRLGRPERNDHGIATVKVLAERSHVVRRDRKRGHGQAQEWVECGTPTYGAAWGSDQHRQIAKRPWKARESYASRRAARCSARLDRSGIDTRLNDERPPSEGPPRTESHCRWRSTPSPCSRLFPMT